MAAKNFIEIGTKFTGSPKELVKNLSGPLAKAGKAAREASLSYDKFSQSLSRDAEEMEKARVGFAGLFTAENQLTLASIQGADAERVRAAGIMRSAEAAQAQVKGLREMNGFTGRFPEMAGWLAAGGQFVIPIDADFMKRQMMLEEHGMFIEALIREGWKFDYSFAGDRKAHDGSFDHVVLTKPAAGQRFPPGKTLEDFARDSAKRGMPRRGRFSLFFR